MSPENAAPPAYAERNGPPVNTIYHCVVLRLRWREGKKWMCSYISSKRVFYSQVKLKGWVAPCSFPTFYFGLSVSRGITVSSIRLKLDRKKWICSVLNNLPPVLIRPKGFDAVLFSSNV